MKKYYLIIVLFTFLFSSDKFITPEQSINYVGKTETVCGEVVSTKYSTGSRGKPTFLNFDEPYPNHIFTTVIWGDKRKNFDNNPEEFYKDKEVCVTGKITTFKNKPQIVVKNQSQLKIKPKSKINKDK